MSFEEFTKRFTLDGGKEKSKGESENKNQNKRTKRLKIDSEMLNKSKNSKAFQGIRCQGDFVPLEHDLWGNINFP